MALAGSASVYVPGTGVASSAESSDSSAESAAGLAESSGKSAAGSADSSGKSPAGSAVGSSTGVVPSTHAPVSSSHMGLSNYFGAGSIQTFGSITLGTSHLPVS